MIISRARIAYGVLGGILLMAAAGYLFWPRIVVYQIDYKMPGNPAPKIAAAQAAAIERRERLIDQTIWKKEMEAQVYGRVFEDFWDALNAATNKWEVVEGLKFENVVFGEWKEKENLGHGIERWKPGKKAELPAVDSYGRFGERVGEWQKAGWGIMQCEFRHNAFDQETNGIPARSRFYFSAHLTNASPARVTVEGDLMIAWSKRESGQAMSIRQIDASGLQVLIRAGPPAFVPVLEESFDPPDLSTAIEPLLVYDLDKDGVPEIALPSVNRIYRWRTNHFESEKFCSNNRLQTLNGLFADFDGDGITDFLYLEFDGIFLLKGYPGGKFDGTPRALTPKMEWFGPRAVTAGDIDGDGDLDVFVGQYKGPFTQGSMPTPYYDANDGYPSYLFRNDGSGNLTDSTEPAGLGRKRFRRVYGCSFVDLDGNGTLDLVVTSDFAGVDAYSNDGRGKFTDVTADWLDEAHAFGMAHVFGDFNNDERLEFFVTGMLSPTAERLEHFGLHRPSSRLDHAMRAKMIFGSRLYLADDKGRFRNLRHAGAKESTSGELCESVARTGWSWGASAADFDNDGWLDIAVANGMESMTKTRDYEGEMWLHDMFVGDSREQGAEGLYFAMKGGARRRARESFGGFEKNRLYLNLGGQSFLNVAHLFGVAVEDDCRNLVAADVDGDGRMDWVFTSQHAMPPVKEKIRVFRNELPDTGNWIGFAFGDEPGRVSPIGARVILTSNESKRVGTVVTGESFRSQSPGEARFGLGKMKKVEGVEIRWPGGAVTRLAGPEINRTHPTGAPKRY